MSGYNYECELWRKEAQLPRSQGDDGEGEDMDGRRCVWSVEAVGLVRV